MIPVTKPFLPPKKDYLELLQGIWSNTILTNNGPLIQRLETKLIDYLAIKYAVVLTNGTMALQFAIKSLDLDGEIITTPFSYVATTASIVWENCKPVFADIDPLSLNIDPNNIEPLINSNTKAILATHCFGNPCDIEAIEKIAEKHQLKVIYDAAHCFGTQYKGKSIFNYGDISVTSFHATKLFHTVEGGALFTNDKNIYSSVSKMRNFGHDGPEKYSGLGINGKNSEFHAAMGLVNLKYVDEILQRRKEQSEKYDNLLQGLKITKQEITAHTKFNYSYYPIILESESTTKKLIKILELNGFLTRRYFYPSLSKLDYVNECSTPISDDISSRILCLPLFFDLKKDNQKEIAFVIQKQLT